MIGMYVGKVTAVYGGEPGARVQQQLVTYDAKAQSVIDPHNTITVQQKTPARPNGPGELEILIAPVGSPVTIIATSDGTEMIVHLESTPFGEC